MAKAFTICKNCGGWALCLVRADCILVECQHCGHQDELARGGA